MTWPAGRGARRRRRSRRHGSRTARAVGRERLGDDPVGHERGVTGDRLERDDVAELHRSASASVTVVTGDDVAPGRTLTASSPSGRSGWCRPAPWAGRRARATAATTTSSSAQGEHREHSRERRVALCPGHGGLPWGRVRVVEVVGRGAARGADRMPAGRVGARPAGGRVTGWKAVPVTDLRELDRDVAQLSRGLGGHRGRLVRHRARERAPR